MDVFSVLNMLGGLALFLYGMNTMADKLQKASGGRLESMLNRLAGNESRGVVLGAAATAVMQSSSATTVTVVGLVNSGIMGLGQAIPVIMGANIGATATSWILSLAGIRSDSLMVELLRPSAFSPVLAAVGSGLLMFARGEGKKTVGGIFLGFSVMMFGMQTMSEAMSPLAENPAFQNALTLFEHPLLGVAAGALLTGLIQSSAASVGILQTLSATGSVAWLAAVPVVMGQNIGTCVTALLSCIGANKNARRAAVAHLYFNLLGTLAFLTAFLIVRAIGGAALLARPVNAAGIAMAHSAFNLGSTALLLPLSPLLEALACQTIPDRASD